MKIAGIISSSLGMLTILMGAFFRFAYKNTLDGSSDLYARLAYRMNLHFIIGIIILVLGIILLVIGIRGK